jgi:cellulose biosynthesis protein BcsQ
MLSPFTHSGTSFVARDFACLAATHFSGKGQRVALVDYDLNQQTQADWFETPGAQARYGALQGPYDANMGETPFWKVSPDIINEAEEASGSDQACRLYLSMSGQLAITRFHWDNIRPGQSVHIVRSAAYWQAMRQMFGLIVVDCPAFDNSDISLNVIPDADHTIIITPESRVTDPAIQSLSADIVAAGGRCAGQILNALHSAVDMTELAEPV